MLPVLVAPLPWGVGAALHRPFAAAFPPEAEPTRVASPGTFEEAVAMVQLAARAKGWPRVVLAGHSMATLVALRAALDAPDLVAGLVLVGGAAGPADLREGLWRPPHPLHGGWLRAWQRFRADGDMRAYVATLLRLGLAVPEAWPALEADLAQAAVDPARMDAFFRDELPRLDLAPRLREVAAPALVVAGREDPLCTVAAAERMARGLPRGRLEVLEGCGHFPWHERPAAFRGALAAFLASLPEGTDEP